MRNVAVDASNGNVSIAEPITLLPGDVTGNNRVGISDLSLLADAFFTTEGDADWNEDADLNCDNTVDINDLSLLADNFFKDGDP